LDLTLAQYFWLVDHSDWSRWFAVSSSHVYALPVTVLLVGLPKNKRAILRHVILLSRVTWWAPVEMLLGSQLGCKLVKLFCVYRQAPLLTTWNYFHTPTNWNQLNEWVSGWASEVTTWWESSWQFWNPSEVTTWWESS
jgi:hypothetical protein